MIVSDSIAMNITLIFLHKAVGSLRPKKIVIDQPYLQIYNNPLNVQASWVIQIINKWKG